LELCNLLTNLRDANAAFLFLSTLIFIFLLIYLKRWVRKGGGAFVRFLIVALWLLAFLNILFGVHFWQPIWENMCL